ncbi:MAG: hypothetical protein KBC28_10690 [Alphaproteobacteria bacterium]|jgi:hypothetical protein|nr:hypothetical protein [Alphaproteobacteria bacterium]
MLFLIFVFINKGVTLKNQYEIKDNSLLGPNKIQTVRYSNKESFLIGTAAGGIETFVNHPLWVWKTRSQYGGYFTLNPKTIYKGVFARVPNRPAAKVDFKEAEKRPRSWKYNYFLNCRKSVFEINNSSNNIKL